MFSLRGVCECVLCEFVPCVSLCLCVLSVLYVVCFCVPVCPFVSYVVCLCFLHLGCTVEGTWMSQSLSRLSGVLLPVLTSRRFFSGVLVDVSSRECLVCVEFGRAPLDEEIRYRLCVYGGRAEREMYCVGNSWRKPVFVRLSCALKCVYDVWRATIMPCDFVVRCGLISAVELRGRVCPFLNLSQRHFFSW